MSLKDLRNSIMYAAGIITVCLLHIWILLLFVVALDGITNGELFQPWFVDFCELLFVYPVWIVHDFLIFVGI